MKKSNRNKRRIVGIYAAAATAATSLLAGSRQAHAQLYYDGAPATNLGWNTSATDWSTTSASPTYNTTWVSGDTAYFQGTANTVTVGAVSAGAIAFTTDGYTLNSGTITLNGTGGNITTSGGTDTIGSIIAGSVGLTTGSSGTLILTNTNTYTGGTTINSGAVLQLGNGGSTGSIAGNIVDNGSLIYNYNSATTLSLPTTSTLSGTTGNLTATAGNISFNGNVNVGGSQSYTQVGNSGSLSEGLGILANTTLTGSSITLTGDIGEKSSSGVYSLALNTSASNGTINLNASFGRAGVWYQLSSLTVNAGTGTINVSSTGPSNVGWNNLSVAMTGAINITTTALGNVGASSFTATGNSTIAASMGLLQSLYGYNSFSVNSGFTMTVSGLINGVSGSAWGGIDKLGAGTMILNNASNAYGQGLELNGGILQFANNALKLWNTGDTTRGYAADFQSSSTLQWGTGDTTDISGTSSFPQIKIENGVTATFDTNGQNVTLAQPFALGTSANGAVVLLDSNATPGSLTLGGLNTFTGGMTISNGTAIANVSNSGTASGAFGPSGDAITLGSSTGGSASLLANSSTVANAVNLGTSAVGTLTIGNNAGSTAAVFSGAIGLNGNNLNLASSGTGSTTISGGISGTGSVTISNTGSATTTISGTTIINSGTITNSGGGSGSTTISAVIGNVAGVTENSATSTLILAAANTYTSTTTISAGTLQIGNGGSTGSVAGSIVDNGTLAYSYNTSTSLSLPTTATLSGTAGNVTASAETIQFNGNINPGGSQSYTENITNSGASYNYGLRVAANTVLTGTTISLNGDIGEAGGNGSYSLQVNTSASNGTINLNASLARGNVFYELSGFVANAGAGAINVTGSGPTSAGWNTTPITLIGAVNMSANVANTGALTINPNGTTTGVLAAALSGGGSLAVSGAGTLTATAAQSYTGATNVTAGTLALGNAGTLANTAVTVSSGATFAAVPGLTAGSTGATNSLGGSLTLNAGSKFTMADGITSTFNVTGAVTFAGGSASSLTFDLGGASTAAADFLNITGNATISAAGEKITINGFGAAVPTGSYTLIAALGASSALATNPFTLANTVVNINGTNYGLSLTNAAGSVTLNIGSSVAAAAYWTGAGGTTWDLANWNSAISGGSAVASPSTLTDVYFSTTSPTPASLTNTLNGNYTINSLNFLSGSGAVTIGADGSTLTINGGNVGNPGITVASGSPAQIINANVTLGGAQTWANNNATGSNVLAIGGTVINGGYLLTTGGTGDITISGNITGTGGLTKTGGGILQITGTANTYSGPTIISGGTLNISGAGALGSGTYAGTITNNAALVYASSASQTFSSAISGTGSVTLSGSGTVILTAQPTYTGGTTITSGTLQLGSGGTPALTLPTSGSLTNNGTLAYNFSSGTAFNLPTGTLSGSGSLTGTAGAINIVGSATFASGSISLTEAGSSANGHGIQLPGSSNSYTLTASSISLTGDAGGTNLGPGGTLNLNTSAVNGPISLNISLGASGFLYGLTSVTANAGTGTITASGSHLASGWGNPVSLTGVLSLTSNLANTSTITVNPNGTTTGAISGVISGVGLLTLSGSGTLSINAGQTYTGTTTITTGKLIIGSSISASSPVVVNTGATLSLTGTNATGNSASTAGPWTINGGTVSADGTPGVNTTEVINGNLTLNAGTLATSLAGYNTTYGNFFVYSDGSQFIVGGAAQSVISASLHLYGTHTFNVAPTGDPSGIDLMVTGEIGNFEGNAWGGINKIGTGTMKLANATNGVGGVILNAGTVVFVSGGLGNAGNPTGFLADFEGNSTLRWAASNTQDISSYLKIADGVTATLDTNGNAVTLASVLKLGTNKTGSLTLNDTNATPGTLTLSAVETYKGATTISAGTLSLTGTLGSGTGGGTAITSAAIFTEGSGGFILGTSSVTVSGGTTTLNGSNSYSGGTIVNGGTLNASSASALGTGPLQVNNYLSGGGAPTLVNVNSSTTIGSLSSSTINYAGASINIASSKTLTVNQTAVGEYDGFITGSGGLALSSSSTSVLTLNPGSTIGSSTGNTYTGGTTVSGGTLLVNNLAGSGSGTGTGTVTVSGGRLGGIGVIQNNSGSPVSINLGGTISPGTDPVLTDISSTGVGVLTTGDMAWNRGTYVFKTSSLSTSNTSASAIVTNGGQDLLVVNGVLNIVNTGGAFTLNIADSGGPLTSNFILANATQIDVNGTLLTSGDITASFTIKENGTLTSAYDVTVTSDSSGGGYGGYDLQVVAAPEPGSLGLLGIASLGLLRRRRTAKKG